MAPLGKTDVPAREPAVGAGVRARASRDDADLCLTCGLCCDGTLFGAIVVHVPEREFVESLGLRVREDPLGGLVAPLPCDAFVGGCCALYAVGRPMTCGSYRCAVVTEYTAGRVDRDESIAVLEEMRSLARALEEAMALAPGGYSMQALSEYLAAHQPWASPERFTVFLVTFHRFAVFAEQHFGYVPRPDEQAARAVGARLAGPSVVQADADSPSATDAAHR